MTCKQQGIYPQGLSSGWQSCSYPQCDAFSQLNWHRVAQLTHRLGPGAVENVVVRERLEARGLSHGEVPKRAVGLKKHVLPTGNSVVAGLEGLRWLVEWTAGVPDVAPGTRVLLVVVPSGAVAG